MTRMTWNGEPFDWTSLDMWVGVLTAVGTVAAVVAAVVLAARAEQRARKAEEDARVAEEHVDAELVTVHMINRVAFEVFNSSERAIHAVRVFAMTRGKPVHEGGTVRRLESRGKATFPDGFVADSGGLTTLAVIYRNGRGHRWASFSEEAGPPMRLPNDEAAAQARVAELLEANFHALVERVHRAGFGYAHGHGGKVP